MLRLAPVPQQTLRKEHAAIQRMASKKAFGGCDYHPPPVSDFWQSSASLLVFWGLFGQVVPAFRKASNSQPASGHFLGFLNKNSLCLALSVPHVPEHHVLCQSISCPAPFMGGGWQKTWGHDRNKHSFTWRRPPCLSHRCRMQGASCWHCCIGSRMLVSIGRSFSQSLGVP